MSWVIAKHVCASVILVKAPLTGEPPRAGREAPASSAVKSARSAVKPPNCKGTAGPGGESTPFQAAAAAPLHAPPHSGERASGARRAAALRPLGRGVPRREAQLMDRKRMPPRLPRSSWQAAGAPRAAASRRFAPPQVSAASEALDAPPPQKRLTRRRSALRSARSILARALSSIRSSVLGFDLIKFG